MKRAVIAACLAASVWILPLAAQKPEATLVYEIKNGNTIVIGGQSFGPWELRSPVMFAPGGKSWAFAAIKPDAKDSNGGKDRYVVINGKVMGPYPSPKDWSELFLSDDGASFGLVSSESEEACKVYVDGKAYGPFKEVRGGIVFDAAGKRWGFVAAVDEETSVFVVNGKQYGPYRFVARLELGAAGTGWIAMAEKSSGAAFAIVDGKEYGPYGWIPEVIVSSDGSHWALETEKKIGKSQIHLVMADGVEYLGADGLRHWRDAKGAEYFLWNTVSDEGDKGYLYSLKVSK